MSSKLITFIYTEHFFAVLVVVVGGSQMKAIASLLTLTRALASVVECRYEIYHFRVSPLHTTHLINVVIYDFILPSRT